VSWRVRELGVGSWELGELFTHETHPLTELIKLIKLTELIKLTKLIKLTELIKLTSLTKLPTHLTISKGA